MAKGVSGGGWQTIVVSILLQFNEKSILVKALMEIFRLFTLVPYVAS